MTLTSTDIVKIQELYQSLERLHADRLAIKDATLDRASGETRKGTSGVEFRQFSGFTPEAQKEIREVIARDLRRRAAKIVEILHKYGCEAKLTEE
jgi:hypothetical protein